MQLASSALLPSVPGTLPATHVVSSYSFILVGTDLKHWKISIKKSCGRYIDFPWFDHGLGSRVWTVCAPVGARRHWAGKGLLLGRKTCRAFVSGLGSGWASITWARRSKIPLSIYEESSKKARFIFIMFKYYRNQGHVQLWQLRGQWSCLKEPLEHLTSHNPFLQNI